MARRLLRAADLLDKPLVRIRYSAQDLIVSLKPTLGGMAMSEPYHGQSFDPMHCRVVKGGWNYEHWSMCSKHVLPGDEWWAALPPDHAGLCLDCYEMMVGSSEALRSAGLVVPWVDRRRAQRERFADMTESEWLTSNIPYAMLRSLEDWADTRQIDRKSRLYACACARRIWHLLEDERSRRAIEVAERYADGLAEPEELDAVGYEARYAASEIYVKGGRQAADDARIKGEEKRAPGSVFGEKPEERSWTAANAAAHITARKVGKSGGEEWYEGGAWIAARSIPRSVSDAFAGNYELRERETETMAVEAAEEEPIMGTDAIAGAVELRRREMAREAASEFRRLYEEPWQADLLRCVFGNPFRPIRIDAAWLGPDAVEVARTIYESRSFETLPDLADALEKAGCRDPIVLDHCRKPGEHARGCWVIDGVLGKA